MRALYLFGIGIIATVTAVAGPFSFGVKAGVPLTDFVDTARSGHLEYDTVTNRYIIGGTAELHLPAGFGVEFDALYRHVNYSSSSMGIDTYSNSRTTGSDWEFPLLVKYRFPTPLVKPFITAGVAFDTLTGLKQTITNTVIPSHITSTTSSNPSELSNTTTKGFVLGGGIDVHVLFLHISPEIRYTHWGSKHFSEINNFLTSNQNQAEFLVGFRF
jgi:opacity protein-like surface antigen